MDLRNHQQTSVDRRFSPDDSRSAHPPGPRIRYARRLAGPTQWCNADSRPFASDGQLAFGRPCISCCPPFRHQVTPRRTGHRAPRLPCPPGPGGQQVLPDPKAPIVPPRSIGAPLPSELAIRATAPRDGSGSRVKPMSRRAMPGRDVALPMPSELALLPIGSWRFFGRSVVQQAVLAWKSATTGKST
jgi:hypothetical protein